MLKKLAANENGVKRKSERKFLGTVHQNTFTGICLLLLGYFLDFFVFPDRLRASFSSLPKMSIQFPSSEHLVATCKPTRHQYFQGKSSSTKNKPYMEARLLQALTNGIQVIGERQQTLFHCQHGSYRVSNQANFLHLRSLTVKNMYTSIMNTFFTCI